MSWNASYRSDPSSVTNLCWTHDLCYNYLQQMIVKCWVTFILLLGFKIPRVKCYLFVLNTMPCTLDKMSCLLWCMYYNHLTEKEMDLKKLMAIQRHISSDIVRNRPWFSLVQRSSLSTIWRKHNVTLSPAKNLNWWQQKGQDLGLKNLIPQFWEL